MTLSRLAAACLVIFALAVVPADAATSFTIRTSGGAVARIGTFHPSRSPTLASAMRAFGTPSSRRPTSGISCRVEWRRLRLRIEFVNLGRIPPGQTTCTPSVGRAQTFTARSSRFRTAAGLRPTSNTALITTLHPNAELRQGSWWLVTAISPFGDGDEFPVLRAIVRDGRVQALAGRIGGAGE